MLLSHARGTSNRVTSGPPDNGRAGVRARPSGAVERLLRVRLFHKIVIANLVLLALGIVGGSIFIPRLALVGGGLATFVLTVAIVIAATTVNIVLVRLALRPIHSLQEAALSVEAGDTGARARSTFLADRQVDGLVRVFNRMLDHQERLRASERRRAARALRQMDVENTRSSSTLYDDLAQTLAGVLLRLRLLDQMKTDSREDANGACHEGRQAVGEIRSEVLHALEGVREIARKLHPPELNELGLGAAVDALARLVGAETGLAIEVEWPPDLPPFPEEVALAVFRIAEEALRNAAGHAHAESARVRLGLTDAHLELEVCDDGTGFDAESPPHGLGIDSIYERAAQAGGTVEIRSHLGEGTCLRVSVPHHANLDEGAASVRQGPA